MKYKRNIKHTAKIKIQIIVKFVTSAMLAFILSVGLLLTIFIAMEYLWNEKYIQIMEWYNNGIDGQIVIMLVLVVLFIMNIFWIFMIRMNPITQAIAELSKGIEVISNGEFDEKIIVHQNNELGSLAKDINMMSQTLKESLEKEKQWNQERYNMITNLSHDLKTPMMSIIGYVDFITEKRYEDAQELETYCGVIKRKTNELNHNINQLFEFAKINSCEFEIKRQDINLLQFTEQILMAYIPQFEENGIEYRISISSDIVVNIDLDSFKRVFENLISNTLKYAYDGGYLDIEANTKLYESMSDCSKSSKTIVIFRNYGKKIEAKHLNQIFTKFYREKDNGEKEGSGYGLYIVKQIVELHGGTIIANSNEKCTEFIITM